MLGKGNNERFLVLHTDHHVRPVAGVLTVDIRHADHRGIGADTGDGPVKYDRNEWIMDLIGIALIALIIMVALA